MFVFFHSKSRHDVLLDFIGPRMRTMDLPLRVPIHVRHFHVSHFTYKQGSDGKLVRSLRRNAVPSLEPVMKVDLSMGISAFKKHVLDDMESREKKRRKIRLTPQGEHSPQLLADNCICTAGQACMDDLAECGWISLPKDRVKAKSWIKILCPNTSDAELQRLLSRRKAHISRRHFKAEDLVTVRDKKGRVLRVQASKTALPSRLPLDLVTPSPRADPQLRKVRSATRLVVSNITMDSSEILAKLMKDLFDMESQSEQPRAELSDGPKPRQADIYMQQMRDSAEICRWATGELNFECLTLLYEYVNANEVFSGMSVLNWAERNDFMRPYVPPEKSDEGLHIGDDDNGATETDSTTTAIHDGGQGTAVDSYGSTSKRSKRNHGSLTPFEQFVLTLMILR